MKKIKLKQLLWQQREVFEIKDNEEYRQVTVSNTGEIKLRSIKKGLEIGTKKQYKIKSGEFIYSRLGIHQGSFGIVPENLNGAIVTGDMPVFKIDNQKILPEILIFLLGQKEIRDIFDDLTRGLAQSRIREKYLLDIEIPDLTIEEQKIILDKIQSIEKEIKQLENNVSHDEKLLRNLRQAILSEAVQGKLVPQDPKDEPAFELLKKIKKEKEKLIKEGKIKKGKELPPIEEDEVPYELPKGWVWCRLGDVLELCEYGTSQKCTDFGNVPVFSMGNINDGKVKEVNLKLLSKSSEDLPRLYLKNKDILFNRTNSYELVGKTGIFKGEDNKFSFASYLIRLRTSINAYYLNYYLQTNVFRKTQIEPEIIQQCGQANFNGTKLKNTFLPLQPFQEQKRIVEKVDALMKLCDELELGIKENKRSSGGLMGAVLGEVFLT